MPSKLGRKSGQAGSLLAWASSRRLTSWAITAGVSTTASAKLNSSTRSFAPPSSKPAEIVAPEREKPLKGRHNPCTSPIQQESSRLSLAG